MLLPIHALFGLAMYQRLYVPILSALCFAHLFFLRRAAATHIRTDHASWGTRACRFYAGYYRFLSVLMIVFAMAVFGSLIMG